MREMLSPFTPARTAIAAVLALSSIPAFAQGIDAAAPPPVTVTEPAAASGAPTSTAPTSPATVAPPAQAPAASQSPTVTFAPAQPVVQPLTEKAQAAPATTDAGASDGNAAASEAAAAPAARRESASRAAPRSEAAPRAEATPAPQEARPEAAAPASPATVSDSAGAEAAPVAAPAPDMTPADTAAAERAATENRETGGDSGTLWLGGGALALLLGGGAAYLMTRRRKSGEELEEEPVFAPAAETALPPGQAMRQPVVEPVVEPAPVSAAVAAAASTRSPSPLDGPALGSAPTGDSTTDLEAMVASDPSPENPFLTRKNRLRRASFLMAQSYPATARLDDRPPLTPRRATEAGLAERPEQVSYSFGKPARPSPRLKPRLSRS